MRTVVGFLIIIALAVWTALAAGALAAIAVRSFELFMGGPR